MAANGGTTRNLPLFLMVGIIVLVLWGKDFSLGNRKDATDLPTGLLATASCVENGAILATGYFNNNTEALYYLDSQSGRLSAALLSRSDPGFTKTFTRNIKADLQEAVSNLSNVAMPQTPSFIMVTGDSDIRNIGAGEMNNLAKSFVYVAEIHTGIVLVYVLPSQGDRDVEVMNEEITFWTYSRLTPGTGSLKR